MLFRSGSGVWKCYVKDTRSGSVSYKIAREGFKIRFAGRNLTVMRVDATARDGKPNPLNEREAKAELWGRGLPVQRGTVLENDDTGGGGGGGLCREGRVRARLNSMGCTRENRT